MIIIVKGFAFPNMVEIFQILRRKSSVIVRDGQVQIASSWRGQQAGSDVDRQAGYVFGVLDAVLHKSEQRKRKDENIRSGRINIHGQ